MFQAVRIYADSRRRGLLSEAEGKVKVCPGQGLDRMFSELMKDSEK